MTETGRLPDQPTRNLSRQASPEPACTFSQRTCPFCGADGTETVAVYKGSRLRWQACDDCLPVCEGTRTKLLRRLLVPRVTLRPGERNVLVLARTDGSTTGVRVLNRFVPGMSQEVRVPLQSFQSGTCWEDNGRVAMHTVGTGGNEDIVDLCKLIVTNRAVFGSSYADCPFRPCPAAYTVDGLTYWNRALQASYARAANARRDALYVETPPEPIGLPSS